MTDRLLIYRFLKNFDIKIGENDFIVFDKFNYQEFKNFEFSKLFLTIFDDYKTDDNRLPFEIYWTGCLWFCPCQSSLSFPCFALSFTMPLRSSYFACNELFP